MLDTMKTKLLWIVACCTTGLSTGANAQEFIRTAVPKAIYKSTATDLLINQQKVADAYRDLNEVYTLDFTDARTKSLSQGLTQDAAKVVSKGEFVDYANEQAIHDLLALRPEVLTVKLPFKGEILVVDLVQADLFGENFLVNSNNPEMVTGVKTGLYYQGTIRGENAVVGFSFFEDEFNALISTDRVADRIIETGRMEDHGRTHIIYSDDDLLVDVHYSCGSEALNQYNEAVEELAKEDHKQQAIEKATYKCVTYFWETSYNMYQSKGTTQAVTNYMTSLFNNFQLLYNNEQIGSKLNQLYIWTTADSYNNSLDTYSANRSNFGANLATLFSTTGGGGVAWLDVVCGSNEYYKHGFCGSVGSSFSNVPNYSWPVNVSTHEVGHNLGSPHTHACSWSGGAIDGCGPTAGYSEGCTAALPSNGGTIMSYCHLVNNVGINLSLGFGTQPGNLIRSRVNSCITLTCDETGNTGGGGTCATAYEPNETQAAAIAITAGTTISAAVSTSTDIDYYKITTSGNTNNTFTLTGPAGVDFDMVIYNSAGTQIGAGTGSTASETVTLNNQAAGTYAIKVFGYNGANSATCYTLNATTVANTTCATAYEPNESLAAAATIPLSTTISGAISSSTDNDYYKVSVTTAGTHAFNLVGPAGVDYDMTIFNSAGTQIGAGTGTTATESVSLSGLAVGTYSIRVFGYNGANSTSCYTLNVARTGASFSGEEAFTAEYTLWPNPATEKLTVESSRPNDAMTLEILDINGQRLSSHQTGGTTTLDVAQLSAGVYFIRITSMGSAITQLKFIKQ